MNPKPNLWLNAFNAQEALCFLAAVGVYFAPIDLHLRKMAIVIIASTMTWLFLREHKRIGTFGKKTPAKE